MTLPPPEISRRIYQLHALMGSTNSHEAASAHQKLVELLQKHGLTWNDLPTILTAADGAAVANGTSSNTHTASATAAPAEGPSVNVLALILTLLEKFVALTAHERMA